MINRVFGLVSLILVSGASGQVADRPQITAQQDHQRLMDLLHISALRQGADGSHPDAPNAASYDEGKANPYPKLPDPLVLKDGTRVATASAWWEKRRPEIIEDFDREIYGRVPSQTPAVHWEVTKTANEMNGDVPVTTKQLIEHVDNAAHPQVVVNIQLALTTPVKASGSHGLRPAVCNRLCEFIRRGWSETPSTQLG